MTTTAIDPETYPEVDPHWVRENIEIGERKLMQIPRRYANVDVTHVDIDAWVDTLVHQSAVNVNGSGLPTLGAGESMLILGPVGTGKTHNAYGVLHRLAKSGVRCSWTVTTAAGLYGELRPRSGVDAEAVLDRYASSQLLILDDLGAAKNSEWVEEMNYRIINHRYENELPTVITSNVPPTKLAEHLGDRVASRLVEMANRVVLGGSDRRRDS